MPEQILPSKPSKHQPRKKIHMKYTNTKLTPWMLLGLLLALSGYDVARATTTISSGHTDIFEAEYEQVGTNAPTIHLGVHTDSGHYEPADVLLEVGNAAYRSSDGFSADITTLLGANAWILPIDLQEADDLGLIEAGVAKAGFPSPSSSVTFTMVGAGADNPGNFALFNSSSAIRLSANGSVVGTSSFSITTGHIHYNWGFSAPGTYTFDMKASYTDATFGALESAVETYTFNVIPEPSSGVLLMAGLATLSAVRRRTRR
jgi:surface-anchored protein